MPRATVRLFLSHVCDDHRLVTDIRNPITRGNRAGRYPVVEFVFGCPRLSGAPGGSSVSRTWQERLASSGGVVFLWTRDAPTSEGTGREWRYNQDVAHRPYCIAVEADADLPRDADPDLRRFRLPTMWVRTDLRPSFLPPRTPAVRSLPVIGRARDEFFREIRTFARSVLVPLV